MSSHQKKNNQSSEDDESYSSSDEDSSEEETRYNLRRNRRNDSSRSPEPNHKRRRTKKSKFKTAKKRKKEKNSDVEEEEKSDDDDEYEDESESDDSIEEKEEDDSSDDEVVNSKKRKSDNQRTLRLRNKTSLPVKTFEKQINTAPKQHHLPLRFITSEANGLSTSTSTTTTTSTSTTQPPSTTNSEVDVVVDLANQAASGKLSSPRKDFKLWEHYLNSKLEKKKKKNSDSEGETESKSRRNPKKQLKMLTDISSHPINSKAFGDDVVPLEIDTSITFDSIGGLSYHINLLKEMVIFPLLYPEIFERFSVTPPRGILFYGPPGCGKTLVARALANTCSNTGQKVSFFMRKGADCLSKWMGETERHLRQLFEQARKMQPSIIFFDEIDGIAPVRSFRTDQSHSSIVSTLLSLMDGLDDRGKVIILGATNRIESIDPALRRPGRFDRELLFTLPNKDSRRAIMNIHTRKWDPPVSEDLLDKLSERCVGYCGADLKQLCTESVLQSIRRNFPQIYSSEQRLVINVNNVKILPCDFLRAMKVITPASQRSGLSHSKQLDPQLKCLFQRNLQRLVTHVQDLVPFVRSNDDPIADDDSVHGSQLGPGSSISYQVHRPRICIGGVGDQGQSLLSGALLHELELFSLFPVDITSLSSDPTAKSPEEALLHVFAEAKLKLPAIIYVPRISEWWMTAGDVLRHSLMSLLQDLDPTLPLMLLVTLETIPNDADLPHDLRALLQSCVFFELTPPSSDEVKMFFENLVKDVCEPKVMVRKKTTKLERLALAPPLSLAPLLTPEQLKVRDEEEEHTLRQFRIILRQIVNHLIKDRQFRVFLHPVSPDVAPDYYNIIKNPISLSAILKRIDANKYTSLKLFLKDIELLIWNAEEYNPPDNDPQGIVSRSKNLLDYTLTMVHDINSKLVKACQDITDRRDREKAEADSFISASVSNSAHNSVDSLFGGVNNGHRQDDSAEVEEEAEEMEVVRTVVVDQNQVDQLHKKLLKDVEGYTVEQLHSLHCHLYRCIHLHRTNYDRGHLIQELTEIIQNLNTNRDSE